MNAEPPRSLSKAERRALDAYLDSAKRVPKVAFVFAEKEPDLHVYVGLERRILKSCERLYEIQDRIREEFEGFQADFHIIYADGRPAKDFVGEAARLVVNWRAIREQQEPPPFKGPVKIYRNVPRPILAPKFGPPVKPQPRFHLPVDSRDG